MVRDLSTMSMGFSKMVSMALTGFCAATMVSSAVDTGWVLTSVSDAAVPGGGRFIRVCVMSCRGAGGRSTRWVDGEPGVGVP